MFSLGAGWGDFMFSAGVCARHSVLFGARCASYGKCLVRYAENDDKMSVFMEKGGKMSVSEKHGKNFP